MAAVRGLSFLLFALINNIHAEGLTVKQKGDIIIFYPPQNSSSCLISRFVGEEKLVLWNTSDLWSQNSTLPEDLKQRLSVVKSSKNISSYVIHNLKNSDSGMYQEACRIDGNMTHEENISLIICSTLDYGRSDVKARLGDTEELPCRGAADNMDVMWLKKGKLMWSRAFGDNTTSAMDNVTGRYQVVKNTSALRVSNTTTTDIGLYTCLKMNQEQCVSSNPVEYKLKIEVIYGSVNETAMLPCAVTHHTDEEPPHWIKQHPDTVLGQKKHTLPSVDQNYSLVFSSLMLNHSGWYECKTSVRKQRYRLVVCPESDPPAVELFSEGEDITLRCTDKKKGWWHHWFIKSNQTEGKIFHAWSDQSLLSRVSWNYGNGNLVISNVSLKDAGEYWCAVIKWADQCLSTTRYVLQYIEPFGVHSTFYKVRWSVLSVGLLMLCVVVVAVNQWTRRGEQLSAQT